MNIKTSLTIKFTAIVGGILLVFSLFTYQFYALFRQNQFAERLESTSYNVVSTFLENEELTTDILKLLYSRSMGRFQGERLFIADEKHTVIFSSTAMKEHEYSMLQQIYKSKETVTLISGDTDYVAFVVPYKNNNYYVVDYAVDVVGRNKLSFLRNILFIMTLGCMLVAAISGWYFARQALLPIKNLVNQIDLINESNLNLRLNEGKSKDEIAALSLVVNRMLERIEKSFAFQKLFIANASHEFRTPLTAMKGQIEVMLLQDRSKDEYTNTLKSLEEDVDNLMALITGLSELASANADFPNVTFNEVSFVEVIMESREELLKRKPDYHIVLKWGDIPEEEEYTTLKGDLSLLKSVFSNLFDNACKFSPDHRVEADIQFNKMDIRILISDNGPGIPADEIQQVFQPFFRSNELRQIPGHGIGLSLVKKTIELHRGTIKIFSGSGKGTQVEVVLPNNFI